MFDKINEIYTTLEEKYDEADRYISKIIDDSIDDTAEYLNNFFNTKDHIQLDEKHDPILKKLKKVESLLSEKTDTNDDIENMLINVATSLGLLNENITKALCHQYNIDLYQKNTQAMKINSLKNFLSKTVINDLHFVNSFRNSILHDNDYGYDLSSLDDITIKKLIIEAKTSIVKIEYIYSYLNDLRENNS